MNLIRNIYNLLLGDRLVHRAIDRFFFRDAYTNCKAHHLMLEWEHEVCGQAEVLPSPCRY